MFEKLFPKLVVAGVSPSDTMFVVNVRPGETQISDVAFGEIAFIPAVDAGEAVKWANEHNAKQTQLGWVCKQNQPEPTKAAPPKVAKKAKKDAATKE